MSCPTCDHLKEDGLYCDSPALHNPNFFHLRLNALAEERRVHPTRRPAASGSRPSDDTEATPNVA